MATANETQRESRLIVMGNGPSSTKANFTRETTTNKSPALLLIVLHSHSGKAMNTLYLTQRGQNMQLPWHIAISAEIPEELVIPFIIVFTTTVNIIHSPLYVITASINWQHKEKAADQKAIFNSNNFSFNEIMKICRGKIDQSTRK